MYKTASRNLNRRAGGRGNLGSNEQPQRPARSLKPSRREIMISTLAHRMELLPIQLRRFSNEQLEKMMEA